MKTFSLLLLGILFFFCNIHAQEVTRGQMMDLFYKAQQDQKAGNTQEALKIYKTILSVDANLSIPYLKMADIYAADGGNQESMAAAAALYKKYLALQPDDENAAAITKKIADLEQLTSNKADLTKLLYIGKDDAQNVFVTKARPGLKARNTKELVQIVDSADVLSNQAQKELDKGNTQGAIQNLQQLADQIDPSNSISLQTNMRLAEAIGNQGDIRKMKEVLDSVEESMNMDRSLSQYTYMETNDATPFEDDICGIWVSDLAYDHTTPFLAIEIQKDKASPQNYKAMVLPYCALAEQYDMYDGKPFQQKAKFNEDTQSYFAYSVADSVHPESNKAYFYFGNEKFLDTSPDVDKYIIKSTVTRDTEETANNKGVANNVGNIVQMVSDANIPVLGEGISLVNTLVHLGISLATYKKSTETGVELNIQRLFNGCADLSLVHNVFAKTPTKFELKNVDSLQIRLYKLYPEDKIFFADDNNEMFGYKTCTRGEIIQTEEYRQLLALKSKDEFNKQSYKKLSDKIADYCFSKAAQDSIFADFAYDCGMRFKYATQGLSYQTFENKDGIFEGWIDLSGKMNGFGKCTLYNGITYIGSWQNNKYSGNGKITFQDPLTGTIVEEYTGGFANNKYQGKGLLHKGTITYEGDFVNGVFEGTGKLTDGNKVVYDGAWKNGKQVSEK